MNDLNLLEKPRSKNKREKIGWFLLAGIVLFGLAICLLLPTTANWILRGPNFVTMLIFLSGLGVLLAVPLLPTIIFTILDAPWPGRLIGIAISLAVYAFCVAGGLVAASTATWHAVLIDPDEVNFLLANFATALPLAMAAIALPFACARYFFGWQLVIIRWNEAPQPQKLTIGGMLISTFIAASCAAGLRMSEVPGIAAAVSAGLGGLGFIFLLPVLHWILRTPDCAWVLIAAPLVAFVFGAAFSVPFMIAQESYRGRLALDFGVLLAAATTWLCLGFLAIRLIGGELLVRNEMAELAEE